MASEGAQPEPVEPRTPRWVHVFACVVAVATFVLICFGGMVKSLEAGLAVPDWPLSHGQPTASIAIGLFALTVGLGIIWVIRRTRVWAVTAIFAGAALAVTYYVSGPTDHWIQMRNLRAEHSHRLIAGTVGYLTAILAGALWRTEPRRWVRRLGFGALLAVIAQAVLGGLTVHYMLPPWISAAHGSLAQFFFALTVVLAAVTSPRWFEATAPAPQPDLAQGKPGLQKLGVMLLAALYFQVLLGTGVRHSTFVADEGNSVFWWHIGSHIVGFLAVAHFLAKTALRVIRRHGDDPRLMRPVLTMCALVCVQIGLGVGAFLYRINPKDARFENTVNPLKETIATAHVATASLLLAGALLLTLRAYRWLQPADTKSGATRGDERNPVKTPHAETETARAAT